MSLIHRVRSALLAAGIGIAAIAPATANDIFGKFSGVTGPVVRTGFVGDVELTAYSQEFTDPATLSSLGGGARGGGGRTNCGAITITKLVDSTSPAFLQFVTRGEVITSATIYFVGNGNATAANAPYSILLTNVRLTSITQGDTVGNTAGLGITENITMIAEKFQFTFRVMNADGGLSNVEKYGWDCLTNRQF
jgi:type VI protein secretion system component Hcp